MFEFVWVHFGRDIFIFVLLNDLLNISSTLLYFYFIFEGFIFFLGMFSSPSPSLGFLFFLFLFFLEKGLCGGIRGVSFFSIFKSDSGHFLS